ncbi:MAG TPA: alpha/beta hydrolase [Gemmatimonadota bacterium]|nr:alpha/beta hydrolase [Gemmatimonadota bacterium]
MGRLSRPARWALGAGAAAGYLWAMVRRNRSLEPPPIRDLAGHPYPERTIVYSDGARVSLVDEGEGETCLLVPGADGIKESFRYQVPAFAERYRTVVADLRSEFGPEDTFDRFVDDVLELTEQLDTGPVHVVGQSLGGPIAMRLAARHPERVRSLVPVNTLYRVSYEHVGLNRSALVPLAMASTRYLPTVLARAAARAWSREAVWVFDDSPGSENVVDYVLWTGARTVRPGVGSRRVDLLRGLDLRPELADIRAPTLVVKGPRDAYCPPMWSREIAALIPGARYVEVPGTGHCSHISMPGAFNRLVLDWMATARLEAEGSRA